jgi:tape measure domain-containing protein
MAITVQEAQVIFSADGLSQVQTKAGIAGKALDRTTASASGLITRLKSMGGAASGALGMLGGLGVSAAGVGMMSLAAGAEQTAIAFEVLLGSAEKSKQMIDAMRALDMKTVFGMRELSESAKMMLNFGVAGEEVVPVLSMITDIASGDSMKLEGLTRAFGQISGAGRLMGQDLNQMIQNGFSPLETISKTTGESMASLKRRMEEGRISIDEVRQSLVWATTGTGRFAGMNDRMSQTTAGQFAKLKSEVELLAIAIGTELLPEANDLLEWARSFFDSTDKIKSKFTGMKNAVRTWFTESQEKFEGVGVIVGVTAVHIGDLFKAMFDDITAYGQAFFDWFMQNSSAIGENAARTARNAVKILSGNTTEKRKVRDDFGNESEVELSTLEFMQPVTPFQAPQSRLGQVPSLMERIDEELAAARKIKAEALMDDGAEDPEGDKKDELKNERKRPAGTSSSQFQTERSQQSQSFSAEALFANLRESALNRQINIAQQSLAVQQQQLVAQNNMIAAVGNINMGLA